MIDRFRKSTGRRRLLGIGLAVALVVAVPTLALAHIERASYWPDPAPDTSVTPPAGGSVPAVRSLFSALSKKAPGTTRVVCSHVPPKKVRKHGTRKRLSKNASIKALNAGLKTARANGYKLRPSQPAIAVSKKQARKLRRFNIKLLRRCQFDSIQAAVTASHNNDRVEVMPGIYTEPASKARPTNDPACASLKEVNDKGETGAVSYRYQVQCPNDQNLIAVIGREPGPNPPPQPPAEDRHGIPDLGPCIRCNLQIQGTGVSPDDVVVDAGNPALGDHSAPGPKPASLRQGRGHPGRPSRRLRPRQRQGAARERA